MPRSESKVDEKVAPLLLDDHEVAKVTGLSVRSVWRFAAAGTLPAPITVGSKLKRWRYSDITAWVESRCKSVVG